MLGRYHSLADYPSVASLAAEAGWSEEKVWDLLEALYEAGRSESSAGAVNDADVAAIHAANEREQALAQDDGSGRTETGCAAGSGA